MSQSFFCAAVAASNRMPLTRWPPVRLVAEIDRRGFARNRVEREHDLVPQQTVLPFGQQRPDQLKLFEAALAHLSARQ